MLHVRLSSKIVDFVWLYRPDYALHEEGVSAVAIVKLNVWQILKVLQTLRVLANDAVNLIHMVSLDRK
jgi:hypothetical protein